MSVVVADTSPLNYLAQCGAIDALPQLYGLVVIPRAVFDELSEKGAPEAVRSWLDPLPVCFLNGFQSDPLRRLMRAWYWGEAK